MASTCVLHRWPPGKQFTAWCGWKTSGGIVSSADTFMDDDAKCLVPCPDCEVKAKEAGMKPRKPLFSHKDVWLNRVEA